MLKIGVSACFMYPDKDRKVFGPKTLSYIENDMANYLTTAGVLPVLIPDLEHPRLEEVVSQMDGFVFQGGTDVSPLSYGERQIENGSWPGDPVRDNYELMLMELAVKSGKPIFGICRGMQIINVYFGGTLYQDTKTQKPGSLIHRDAEKYDSVSHAVTFATGGFLDKLYSNAPAKKVNSVHHQSIKDLADGMEVLAVSPEDGAIEAIALKSSEGNIFGVQWHPEFSHTLGDEIIDASRLYAYFVDQVRNVKSLI